MIALVIKVLIPEAVPSVDGSAQDFARNLGISDNVSYEFLDGNGDRVGEFTVESWTAEWERPS